jgi:RNA polymerase sigma factor (sigma-70 family)
MASAALVSLLEQARRVVAEVARPTDRELLERFATQHDGAAFEALVRRHGPMVLGACRRVLGSSADADDVFQAAFLVLAKKAATGRWRDSIASWLYRTAVQLARKARTAAARRARHEARVLPRLSGCPLEELSARELLDILDEELLGLPDRYRAPLVLCYLQGATRDEAARELGCPPATLKCWLERGRQRLHDAVRTRGLTLPAVLGAALAGSAAQAVTGAVVQGVARAASAVLAGRPLSGLVSTPVIHLVEGGVRAMLLGKLRVGLVLLLVCGAMTGVGLYGRNTAAEEGKKARPADRAGAKKDLPAKPEAGKANIRCAGRVLRPDGKPAVGAKVFFVRSSWVDNGAVTRSAAKAVAGADGRFVLVVPQPEQRQGGGLVMAVEKGYGPGWLWLSKPDQVEEATVKLVEDNVPIEGRVLDLEGKPIAGATARVMAVVGHPKHDLGPWLAEVRKKKTFHTTLGRPYGRFDLNAAGLDRVARTDAAGKFRLTGFGRERLVTLRIEGPTIETQDFHVVTRRDASTLVVPRQGDTPAFGTVTIRPASFDHAAAPTRPVEGVVRDVDTGKPLAGVPVEATLPSAGAHENREMLRTTTDREGRYRIVGLPRSPGQRVYVFPKEDQPYLPAGLRTPAAGGTAPARLDFALKRGILIRGKVTDKATGQPVRANVQYFIFSDNPHLKEAKGFTGGRARARLSREDGTFTVLGLPGRGLVTATMPRSSKVSYLTGAGADRIKGQDTTGHYPTWPYLVHPRMHNTLVEINPRRDAQELNCNLTLDPGRTITGTVVDPDGKPVKGVQVTGSWGATIGRVVSGEDGRFTLRPVDTGHPQPFFFQHPTRKLGVVVLFKDAKVTDVTVKLQPCGVIKGRLLDLDEQVLAQRGLVGYLEDNQLNVAGGWAGLFWAKTDQDGRFQAEVIPGISVGAYFDQAPARLGEKIFQKLTLKPGEVKDVGDVKINPRAD